MKICPNCNTKYTDETLNFCLQDGTGLIGDLADSGSHPTVSLEETPTVISGNKAEQISFDLRQTDDQKEFESQIAKVSKIQDVPNKNNTLATVLLTVLAMLIVFGIGGVGAYLYFNNSDSESAANANVYSNQNGNSKLTKSANFDDSAKTDNPTPKKAVKPISDKTPKPTPNPTPELDLAETKKAVSDTIYQWKSLAEARDLSAYMNNYASKLDYYNKKGASRSFVQSDKQKAFSKYDNIKANLSNMSISPSSDGMAAVAEFDKEWVFKSIDSENSGKVRTQLKLKKDGEKWLITSEKDLKIYYVNK